MSSVEETQQVGRWAVSRQGDGWYLEDVGTDLVPHPQDVAAIATAMDDQFPEGLPAHPGADRPDRDRVAVRVEAYGVNALPQDHDAARHFELRVESRGNGWWAVTRGTECLSIDGDWDYEPLPSARTTEWVAAHRFGEAEAIRMARQACRAIRVNGVTAEELLAVGT